MIEVNRKVLVIALALMAVAMLTTSAYAGPTKGQKVPITIHWGPSTTQPDVPRYTGNSLHNHGLVNWVVAIDIDGVPTYTGIAATERYVVMVQLKDGINIVFKEVYDMSIDGEDGGFVGSATILMEGVNNPDRVPSGKAHGLLHGYGVFEGQTINAGHHWSSPIAPIVWDGYLLKP